MKRKLCLLLSVVLILTLFPVYAFADDPEESDSSGDSNVITDDMVDAELQSIANNLYEIQLLNDTRATTYTATDIYNFMVNHFLMGGAQNGYMYQIYSFVTSLNTKVQAIMTYANSIREYTELIHDSVTGDNTVITLYDLIGDHLGNISNMLGVTEGDTTLSAAELLLLINNTIDDSYVALGNILSTLASIQNNIALLYSVMTDIAASNNDIVTQTTTINANMQTMIARLQSIQNDFNNLTWTSLSTFKVYDNYTDAYNYSDNVLTGTTNLSDIYISINFTSNRTYSYIGYLNIPLFYTFPNDLIVTIPYSNTEYDVPYYINCKNNISRLYIDLTYRNYQPYIIHIHTNNNTFRYNASTYSYFYYIDSSNIDYYTVYNQLSSMFQNRIFRKFESLYASDDLIAAKEDQQGYEDQAIEDFTGSGSAAAKGSDLTDMKSISGALKQGLSSGGSVSNALSAFNTNSGFWGWFSQSNYDDINNLSTPSLRSGNSRNEPEIIDFYNDNQLTLHSLLSGGDN